MYERYAEPAFDVLIATGTILAFTAYMLGLFVDPKISVIVGVALIGLGVIVLVPRRRQILAGTIGSLAVVVGGAVIPRVVIDLTTAGNELMLTLTLSGFVILLSFAAVRLTIFSQRPAGPL